MSRPAFDSTGSLVPATSSQLDRQLDSNQNHSQQQRQQIQQQQQQQQHQLNQQNQQHQQRQQPNHIQHPPSTRPPAPGQQSRLTTAMDAGRSGSLGNFAAQVRRPLDPHALTAQMTCFFWFEAVSTLRGAERSASLAPATPSRLAPDAASTPAFRRWVAMILSTTQVTPNVILLALLFIYRLRTSNPKVQGKPSSEYRLLAIALMLGNKFLDDNTYTNKTWAEVSGISVAEINVMEVEFLSSMRYSLLASAEQWEEWQVKLRRFSSHIDRCSATNLPVTPTFAYGQLIVPSPPASKHSSPLAATSSAISAVPTYNSHPRWATPLPPTRAPSVAAPASASRKRSHDDAAEDPPSKRPSRQGNGQSRPRLPVPNLSISTSQPGHYPSSAYPRETPILPPLSARSAAYPTTPQPGSGTPTTQQLQARQNGAMSWAAGQPSSAMDPMRASPTTNMATHHDTTSPLFYMQQNRQPYNPVRLPNTLLHSLRPDVLPLQHDYHDGHNAMHYLPLGKRNDYRTGVVPDYTHAAESALDWAGLPGLPFPSY
jgi:hypothetical protein